MAAWRSFSDVMIFSVGQRTDMVATTTTIEEGLDRLQEGVKGGLQREVVVSGTEKEMLEKKQEWQRGVGMEGVRCLKFVTET